MSLGGKEASISTPLHPKISMQALPSKCLPPSSPLALLTSTFSGRGWHRHRYISHDLHWPFNTSLVHSLCLHSGPLTEKSQQLPIVLQRQEFRHSQQEPAWLLPTNGAQTSHTNSAMLQLL